MVRWGLSRREGRKTREVGKGATFQTLLRGVRELGERVRLGKKLFVGQ